MGRGAQWEGLCGSERGKDPVGVGRGGAPWGGKRGAQGGSGRVSVGVGCDCTVSLTGRRREAPGPRLRGDALQGKGRRLSAPQLEGCRCRQDPLRAPCAEQPVGEHRRASRLSAAGMAGAGAFHPPGLPAGGTPWCTCEVGDGVSAGPRPAVPTRHLPPAGHWELGGLGPVWQAGWWWLVCGWESLPLGARRRRGWAAVWEEPTCVPRIGV